MHRIQKSARAWLVVACALACAPWVAISADAKSEEAPSTVNAGAVNTVHFLRRTTGEAVRSEAGAEQPCTTAFSVDSDGSLRTLYHFGRAERCHGEAYRLPESSHTRSAPAAR